MAVLVIFEKILLRLGHYKINEVIAMNKIIKIAGMALLIGAMMTGGVAMSGTPVWADGATIEERLASLESYVSGLKYDVAYISQKNIVPMLAEQEALRRNYNILSTNVQTLSEKISGIYDLLAGLPQGVDEEMVSMMADLDSRLMVVEQEFMNLNGEVTDLKNRIGIGENSVNALSETLERVNRELKEVQNAIIGRDEMNGSRIIALESQINGLNGQMTSIKEGNVGLSAQVRSLLNRVEALSGKLQENEAKVSMASGAIERGGADLGVRWAGIENEGVSSVALGTMTNVNKPDSGENKSNTEENQKKNENSNGGLRESQKGAQEEMDSRTTEVVEVPETGGEKGSGGWWLILVMLLLGVGVVAWWWIPRILAKKRN